MRIKMPAVRIAQVDSEATGQHPDILMCGVCQKSFALGDINKFIQHKVHACNKENYVIEADIHPEEDGDGGGAIALINRRPSISAPIKKINNARLTCSSPLEEDCNTPKARSPNSSASPTPIKDEMECDEYDVKRRIKQESDSTNSSPDLLPKKNREVADAESNTTHSEPSYYICSTCKARLHSAWRLVQHAQRNHGMKIYVESATSNSSSPSTTNSIPPKNAINHSSSSSCSVSSACSGISSGVGPLTSTAMPLPPSAMSSRLPLLPPTTSTIMDPHNPFSVGGLLRMPMSEPRHHQFPVPMANGPPVFTRPSSHHDNHFRMEQIVSEQFRLNQHHSLGLAAAAAAVAAAMPPAYDRPPNPIPRIVPPAPSLSLPLEPQLDFYSQRLRQLAGTTSPGVSNSSNSLSPRKMTPPFTSPGTTQLPNCSSASPHNGNNNNVSVSNNNLNGLSEGSDTEQCLTPPLKLTNHDENNDSLDLSTAKSEKSVDDKPADYSMQNGTEEGDSEDKTFECEYCTKKFRFQSNLIVHRRIHTGEKPYKCAVCDHACTQSSKLKRHMRVHKQSNLGNGETGGEAGVTSTNGDGSTTSTPDDNSNNGSDDERMDDDMDEEDEEDEEDDEEDDLEEEEDMELDDDDDDDSPEDLTTKSTPSTPRGEDNKSRSPRPTPSQTPLDKNNSDKVSSSGSLVGELMDKFGLSNIQQYSEAYKQALQESHNPHIRKKGELPDSPIISDNNNGLKIPSVENGLKLKSMKLKEEFAKSMMANPPMDMIGPPHGFFGTGLPFENLLDVANKRIKLDIDRHNPLLGRNNIHPDESWNPGLWLPAMAAAHHRDLFRNEPMEILRTRKSENHHRKSMSMMNHHSPHLKRESRRNDTCEYCGKVFKNCSNLTVHRRSHTGEKPYKCELCSYACAQSSKLTRHMKTHGRMGKDVYRCRFCEMPFSVPSTLEKHMRKCVVNQNIKGDHLMPSMMIKCEDDSLSSSKDNT